MGVEYNQSFSGVNRKKFRADYSESCKGLTVFRGDRLIALLAENSLSQSELARRIGVSQATIWKLASTPSQGSKHIHRIASELATSPEYLMGETDDRAPLGVTDRRVPFRSAATEPDPDEVEIDMIDLAFGMGGTFLDAGDVEVRKARFSRAWLRQFTPSPPHLLVTTQGVGDSMMPTILDGDVVVIDRSEIEPEFGDKIWAIKFGGVGMIKRLRPMPDGTVKISSDNQLVRDDIAADGELFIVGRVVAIVRKV